MLIKKVVLNNIRSYSHEEIRFSDSKILLAGDIGSGKSTILLAIEFALFGTLRGELSGAALLRNGAKTGSVDLEFELNAKKYIIHRALKKGKRSVEQEPGYVIIDSLKKEMTPVELKAFILNLLNYPKEYLTKTKNLIYRYTVYTPQEEMKRILLEDPETRTGILRKIFNIDKYERIKSNSNSYTRLLREKQRAFEAVTKDLEEKKRSLEEREKELKDSEDSLERLAPKLKIADDDLKQHEQILKEHEKKVKEKNEISAVFSRNNAVIEQKMKQIKLLEDELTEIEDALKEIIKDTKDKSKDILDKEKAINDLELSLKKFIQESAEINTLIDQSDKLVEKIKVIDNCPTCLQEVKDEHKSRIHEEEAEKKAGLKEKKEINEYKIKNSEDSITKLKEELIQLRRLQQEHLISLQKKKVNEEKLLRKEKNMDIIKANKKELKSLEKQQSAYEKVLKDSKADEEHALLKQAFEELRKKHQALLVEESRLKERLSQVQKYIALLQRDINSKLEAKKKLEHSKNLHGWFTDYFIPLLDVVEKHVMARIHQDFNDLFQQWFSMLVDDDMLYANLDDSFTPVILQNGYDIEYSNLSGGERTACALAYRLALNKVINDIFTDAKTKDLLILDEPTDGFSEEQLDKMRDVLDQLNLKQILIVSHEPKIEGFVDNIIRVQKQGHVSKII